MKTIILNQNKMKTEEFKIGDLVKVNEHTHDECIPANRTGIVVYCHKAVVHYSNKKPVDTGVRQVLFTNGNKLNIHKMFLMRVE